MTEIFTGSFTQQEPIPAEGIAAANAVMQSGRLHRYNTSGDEIAQAALLEEEFAASVGAKYCLAVASGHSRSLTVCLSLFLLDYTNDSLPPSTPHPPARAPHSNGLLLYNIKNIFAPLRVFDTFMMARWGW